MNNYGSFVDSSRMQTTAINGDCGGNHPAAGWAAWPASWQRL